MRRPVVVVVAVLVLLFVASQLIVPPIAEHDLAGRLTAGGGHAQVELSAFPALRLLTGHGDRIRIRARGLDLPLSTALSPQAPLLARLDKFGAVDIQVSAASAGPFRVDSLSLARASGAHAYNVSVRASTSPADLATYTGGQLGGSIGGLLGSLAGSAVPFADASVPIDVSSVVRSVGGRPTVLSTSATIAGIPLDPLIEALSLAVAGRI